MNSTYSNKKNQKTTLISVVIPTYNRYQYLLNTIKSIKSQTYSNIEIIVVNDCSTQNEYYSHDWSKDNIIFINLPVNSRKLFGYPCAGFVRNQGIQIATGQYIAFCDDDDIWLKSKLEIQLNAIEASGCGISSTDGLVGHGVYNEETFYRRYNSEHCYDSIQKIFSDSGSSLLINGFPEIWNRNLIAVHNCVICSSVVINYNLLKIIGFMPLLPNGREDYQCWISALNYTDLVYVSEPCFYYDLNHGSGRNY